MCTGCSLIVPGDQQRICLALLPEGQIIGDFTPRSESGGLHAALVVQDEAGRKNSVLAPFGFDRVQQIPSMDSGFYYVFAANRENDIPKSFDAVYLVHFSADGPTIDPIITKMGFGVFAETWGRWFVVFPTEKPEDLKLLQLDQGGGVMENYAFGKDLQLLDPDPDLIIAGVQVLDDGDVLVNFWKEGVWQDKSGPFYRVIVSLRQKTVQIAK